MRHPGLSQGQNHLIRAGRKYVSATGNYFPQIVVIKRDGRSEDFDREKLVRSVRAACHKRPVDTEQITMLVEDVMDAMEAQFEKEIPSRAIGAGVMQRLRTVDQVAYVRFASVYKEFRDVAEFVDEISTLAKAKPEPSE